MQKQDKLYLKGEINFAYLKQILAHEKKLPNPEIQNLIHKFTHIAQAQPNILKLNEPVVVVGDVHGQFADLLKILSLFPSLEIDTKLNVLFLGDYVDRGPNGVQVTLLLMAFKIKFPTRVFMLRGNHESRQMTQIFNFYNEVCNKYNQNIYFDFMDAFDTLPLACIVNQKYFCVHGGISQDQDMSAYMKIDRFDQVPLDGPFCDLVWSDPVCDDNGETNSGLPADMNSQRNCSIFYGAELTSNFLRKNKLINIVRAHEVQMEGYKQHHWPNWKDIPMVYTIFSAPNYCGTSKNLGAILTISKSQFKIRQFKQTSMKYYLPIKYDAFSFTIKKLNQVLDSIMKRLAKTVVKKNLPQFYLKGVQIDDMINMYIKSEHCHKLVASKKPKQLKQQKDSGESQQMKQITDEEWFNKSLKYQSTFEKRPTSLIFKKSNSNQEQQK